MVSGISSLHSFSCLWDHILHWYSSPFPLQHTLTVTGVLIPIDISLILAGWKDTQIISSLCSICQAAFSIGNMLSFHCNPSHSSIIWRTQITTATLLRLKWVFICNFRWNTRNCAYLPSFRLETKVLKKNMVMFRPTVLFLIYMKEALHTFPY